MDAWTQEDREEFGRRLKIARQAVGMAQNSVAKQLGLGDEKKGTVSAWEVGSNMPTAETVARLAELYNVSSDFLLFGDVALGPDAMAFAEAYESLSETEQAAFRALWYGWVNGNIRPPAVDKPPEHGLASNGGLPTLPEPVRRVESPLPSSTTPAGAPRRENLGGAAGYRGMKRPRGRTPTPRAASKKK